MLLRERPRCGVRATVVDDDVRACAGQGQRNRPPDTLRAARDERRASGKNRLVGGEQKAQQGYGDRTKIRRIMGDRLAREIVLAPRTGA